MRLFKHRDTDERGQILVIVALGLVVMVAMVGIVIDGGYAWGKQRETQNGSDAASEAGAVLLAQNLAGTVPAKTDADVRACGEPVAVANGIGPAPAAWYTDFNGNLLDATGAIAPDTGSAAQVGNVSNAIPPGTMGVRVDGQQTFDTFLARVIGFNQFTTTTTATARAGYLGGTCSAGGWLHHPAGDRARDGPRLRRQQRPGASAARHPVARTQRRHLHPALQERAGQRRLAGLDAHRRRRQRAGGRDPAPIQHRPDWPGWYYITATGNVNSKQHRGRR